MKYDKNVLAKMSGEEMFHFDNTSTGECSYFYFDRNGDVCSNESFKSYPSMRQMFNDLYMPSMRPSKCVNEAGYSFPEVYEDYIDYDDYDYEEFEDLEPEDFEPVKTNADIAQDIFHGFLSGEINLVEAVDQAFEAVKERCGLPEKFLTEIETTIKLTKLLSK